MDHELEYGAAGQMRPAPRHTSTTPSGAPAPPRVAHLPQHVYIRRRVVLGGMVAAAGFGATMGIGRLLGDKASAGAAQASGRPDPVADTTGSSPPVHRLATGFIAAENALPGTSEFAVKMERPFVDMLHAWCDHDSARSGDTVTIFATTKARTFTAEAFRFGWYGGKTGRRVWQADAPFDGFDQKPPTVDAKTNMRSCAHWVPSFTVDITDDWPPGMYMFRLIGDDGGNTFVPLTILDDRRAPVLVVSAITTWNAYNLYGGASLYEGEKGRSQVVTFDRPYDNSGSGHFFGGEYELVQMIESMGIDVAYTTNIDLHARPGQIAAGGYKAIISLAHDEYYSVPIRHALQSARDAGVNLMFLGANAGFRRIRLEASSHGPHRLEVNYRVAKDDPLYGKGDQSLVTTEWRSAPAADPEAGLVGNYYESNPVKADMVVVNPASWILAGTGLKKGHKFKDMVQNEYDRVTPEVKGTPYNIEVICHSPLVCRGKASFADVTYYTAPSGAGVFATGTLWWERQLGAVCDGTDKKHTDACYIRQITANVLQAFVTGPAGRVHPAKSNLAALGIRKGYVKSAPPHVDEKSASPGSGGGTSGVSGGVSGPPR